MCLVQLDIDIEHSMFVTVALSNNSCRHSMMFGRRDVSLHDFVLCPATRTRRHMNDTALVVHFTFHVKPNKKSGKTDELTTGPLFILSMHSIDALIAFGISCGNA